MREHWEKAFLVIMDGWRTITLGRIDIWHADDSRYANYKTILIAYHL